ncbi:hypothetical protein ACGFI9_37690 [Micromonospora sp. NPDC048930]|uniref:hypothetical protein n=1 Tax=Micromonospora sp. NPDC048930 TaxID=3364261 RepID=UPI00371A5589
MRPVDGRKVAEWHFDEVGPGPASDASGMYHDLTFYGEAVIPASGAGQTGTGLRLDDVDDYAAPDDGQVLNTDQSFTVSAWVRLLPSGQRGDEPIRFRPAERGSPVYSLKPTPARTTPPIMSRWLPATATDWRTGFRALVMAGGRINPAW